MKLEPSERARELAPLALVIYGGAAVISFGLLAARGKNPLEYEAWLSIGASLGHGVSLAAGALLALGTALATREFVRRWAWARALHAHLRPAVRGASDASIFVLGIASAAGEELFFRALLTPVLGLVLSSLAFGLLHQVRGRGRWAWVSWATVMGFLFGCLFLATGSLLGPVVAHAGINVANLRFLRDYSLEPPRARRLGGLLGRA